MNVRLEVRYGSLADIAALIGDVRDASDNGHRDDWWVCRRLVPRLLPPNARAARATALGFFVGRDLRAGFQPRDHVVELLQGAVAHLQRAAAVGAMIDGHSK